MTEPKVTLGTLVREYRERAGLSQERLAEALGVSREAVSKIERGDTKRPAQSILLGLERVLGLSRRRLYDLIGDLQSDEHDPLEMMLIQIAALPDREERRRAWQALPDSVRESILRLAQDVWQDTLQQIAAGHPATPQHQTEK